MDISEERVTKISTADGDFAVNTPLVITQNICNLMITGLAHMRYSLSLEEMALIIRETFDLQAPHYYWLAKDMLIAADYIVKQRERGG